ncbi:MAG: PH domain-containing protein [Bacteroidota bacterium]
MPTSAKILQTAEFNPKIKTYLLLYGVVILAFSLIGIPLLVIWLLGVGQYISKRYYESLSCTLTTRHLEFNKGVLFRVEKTIPLENIQDLTFIENPLLRIFDLRILKIETAGQSNPSGSDMKLIGILDTPAFKEKVLEQRERLISESRQGDQPGTSQSERLFGMLSEIKDLLVEIKNK